MRLRHFFILPMILLLSIMIGCSSNSNTSVTAINLMASDNVVIMPHKMPKDFHFSLKYGVGALNEINTFENTYTKDLVLDGTITTGLTLTKKERKAIYYKMKEIELLETVQNARYEGEDGSSIWMEPASEYYLTIQMNGEIYKVHWAGHIYDKEIRDMLAIFVLRFLHGEIIENKQEFKKLPKANGWYL
ncbi:hypothetical protein DS745_03115 [Anaerobacillus alkaliphilus]|uniref:Lipoprotein n=1 Tax=Anaerobacillus alkaliphilus TaxID=1548597 RepID=A0A4Q0VXV5_9BACI|nr:hypothetical protein [Anaerobacillus alkaliphilus]RXJ04389.1 hypothetical protein DS745_03115 [Anaerobacillus alkaliphilus]